MKSRFLEDNTVIDLIENDLYQMAEEFLDAEYENLNKPMSTSQIKGIENILSTSEDTEELKRFLKHQADKSHKEDEATFFRNFYNQIDKTIQNLIKEKFPQFDDKSHKKERKEIHNILTASFIQHLVAHHYYIAKKA